jgi:hypothetical protein
MYVPWVLSVFYMMMLWVFTLPLITNIVSPLNSQLFKNSCPNPFTHKWRLHSQNAHGGTVHITHEHAACNMGRFSRTSRQWIGVFCMAYSPPQQLSQVLPGTPCYCDSNSFCLKLMLMTTSMWFSNGPSVFKHVTLLHHRFTFRT